MANSPHLSSRIRTHGVQSHGVLCGLLYVLLVGQTAVSVRFSMGRLVASAEPTGKNASATLIDNIGISATGARGHSLDGAPPVHGRPLPSGYASAPSGDDHFHKVPDAKEIALDEVHPKSEKTHDHASLLGNAQHLVKRITQTQHVTPTVLGLLTGVFIFVVFLGEQPPSPQTLSDDGLIHKKYYRASEAASAGKAASEDKGDDDAAIDMGKESAQLDGNGESCGTNLGKLSSALATMESDLSMEKCLSMPAKIVKYSYEPILLSSDEEGDSPGGVPAAGDDSFDSLSESEESYDPQEPSNTEAKAKTSDASQS